MSANVTIIQTAQGALKVIEKHLSRCRKFTWDIETTGLDPVRDTLKGISVAWSANDGVWITVDALSTEVLSRLQECVDATPNGGANLKFDMKFMKFQYRWEHEAFAFDVQLEAHLLNEERKQFALWEHSRTYQAITPDRDTIDTAKEESHERLAVHAVNDVLVTYRAHQIFTPMLKEDNLTEYYTKMLLPIYQHFVDVELTGIPLDREYLPKLKRVMLARIDKIEEAFSKRKEFAKVEADTGLPFNVNSPTQISKALYEYGGCPVLARSKKTQNPSTPFAILEELRDDHGYTPAKWIIAQRHYRKILEGYVNPWLEKLHDDGRYRDGFWFTGTKTGRLASGLHTIMQDPAILRAIAAPDGYVILAADYGQMEARVAAALTEEPEWIKAFNDGLDIYRVVATKFFDVSYDNVTVRQRDMAKVSLLALMYGMRSRKLAATCQVSLYEAENLRQMFFSSYKRAAGWEGYIKEQLLTKGYVRTPWGRIRRFVHQHWNKFQYGMMNEATNSPIQGGASDLCLTLGMTAVNQCGPDLHDFNYVHDSVYMLVPKKGHVDRVKNIIQILEHPDSFDFPFSITAKVGLNVRDAKEFTERIH